MSYQALVPMLKIVVAMGRAMDPEQIQQAAWEIEQMAASEPPIEAEFYRDAARALRSYAADRGD